MHLTSVWSSFFVVEKCRVAVRRGACSVTLPVLKLTVFGVENSERTYFVATKGLDASQVRDYWLGEVKLGIGRVTLSLLPPHAIDAAPVNEIASTWTRIMAGYLLQCVAQDSVCLYCCELHADLHSNLECSADSAVEARSGSGQKRAKEQNMVTVAEGLRESLDDLRANDKMILL